MPDRTDRTAEIAERLRTDPRIVALVLGAPWRRVGPDVSRSGPVSAVGEGRADGRGRMYVGVPSPSELSELGLPTEVLRHFGLSPADLRAGGWTDTDLRSAGLTPPGAEPEPVEWFVAGEPPQLMLGLAPSGPPLLARPEPGAQAGGVDPVEVHRVPDVVGCTDPESDGMLLVRQIRDRLVRRARRRLAHCGVCLRQVLRTDPATGVCPDCAAEWLGVLP
ncbi:hypothetical protein [Pseudonocardia sp. NPDC049635]|uniref:hypothetical protein n=1 Tax=Pseudonocardia sp. NPDC049635 TaxID=3155506 RepID=UPI0033C602EE